VAEEQYAWCRADKHFSAVNLVGILDDERFLCLPENLGQLETWHLSRANHVFQNVTGTNRGQLVSISNKENLTAIWDSIA